MIRGIGRFMSADTVVDGVYDSVGYNRYTYVRNNPINYSDPSGRWWQVITSLIYMCSIINSE